MIRGLDEFLRAAGLVHTLPLTTLKETRLGIDLGLYLEALVSAPETTEIYVAALGGSPLALITHIENDLRALDKSKVKPVFVLSGIQPAARAFGMTTPKGRAAELHSEQGADQRRQAWECYERGDVDQMNEHLRRSQSVQVSDLIRSVLRAFRHRNIEYMVAPYLAEAQLVSLERHSKSYVHAIYGSTETLLFDRIDKVILSLDFRGAAAQGSNGASASAATFTYVSKAEIMLALRCSEEEFLDIGLLLGFRNCPTFQPLLDGTIPLPPPRPLGTGAMSPPTPAPHPLQALDVIRQHRSGYTAALAFAEHRGSARVNYVESFCKARCLIKFSLVISAEEGRVLPLPLATPTPPVLTTTAGAGSVQPGVNGTTPPAANTPNGAPVLSTNDIPNDLHDVFTHRLPDELYFHISRGLLSPAIPEWLAGGAIKESAPLGDPDTDEWTNFMRSTITESPHSPRCIALALLSNSLNSFWQSRKVYAHYHFDRAGSTGTTLPIDSAATQNLIARVNSWNVGYVFVEDELRRQMSSTIDIALCLGATGRADLAEKTRTPRPSSAPDAKQPNGSGAKDATKSNAPAPAAVLEKKDEIVANVIWRFLELRGFLNHDHLHTPFARALHLSIRASRLNDKFQEPLYIALELIRAGVLVDKPYGGTLLSGGPSWGDPSSCDDAAEREVIERSRRHLLLIMRVLSLVPMSFKPQPWASPLSRELLQFNNFAKSMTKNLRLLVEIVASSLLLKGGDHVKRNRDDYLDISLSLPFLSLTSTGLGIVIKCYFEALLTFNAGPVQKGHEDDPDVVDSRGSVIGMIDEAFPNIKDIRSEIARGFRFWNAVMQAIDVLATERSLDEAQIKQFREADEWLQPMARV